MVGSKAQQTKVHFKGKDDDFIVFVEDFPSYQKWKRDNTVPLAQVVNVFKIFITHKQGAQGQQDSASHSTLENEFGTLDEEECIMQILKKGTVQESEFGEKQSPKNDSRGSRAGP